MIKKIKNHIFVGLILAAIGDIYTVQAMDTQKEDLRNLLKPATLESQFSLELPGVIKTPERLLEAKYREMLMKNQTDFNKWVDDIYAIENGFTILKRLESVVSDWGYYGIDQFNKVQYLILKVGVNNK